MAGSFNHIVTDDGTFTFDTIENLGDAYEMAEECYNLILHLAGGDWTKIRDACRELSYVQPKGSS